MDLITDTIGKLDIFEEQASPRAYKPVRFELGYNYKGLHPSTREAHAAVQWFLNDIMQKQSTRRRWVTLLGASGTGKTHLLNNAAALLKANGKTVSKYNWVKLFNRMCDNGGLLPWLESAQVLIIDDIGAGYMESDKARALQAAYLYELAEARLNKWTLLSSNLTFENISSQLDPRVASRLMHGCSEIVSMFGAEDYRMRRFKSRNL